ncbi:MAG TPA: MBL fold metallo-hydrolase [Polyangiales bacterium]|nr:MBL fold metallo-hydrolase [Polyangiales bacterium]
MTITNSQHGTSVHEIAAGIYRISTPVSELPGGFTFNQFLVVDEAPLLYHTGPRKLLALVREAVQHVLGDVAKLRYVGFSHVEADECGSLNEWLALAPEAQPVCGEVAAMVSVGDLAVRPPFALREDEWLSLGQRRVRWLATPHLPHNWECGHLYEASTRTLFCGDVLTQPGAQLPALTEGDLIGPSEAMRLAMPAGSVAVEAGTRASLEKLAACEPTTLATMHGSSYRGDGGRVLRDYASALGV